MISRIRRYVWLSLLLTVWFSIQSCAANIPATPSFVTSTIPVTLTVANVSTPTKILTPTLGATNTITPVPVGNFVPFFYPSLIMNYDPSIWEDKSNYAEWGKDLSPVPGTIIDNHLQALELQRCQIGVIGPSGNFPTPDEIISLGNVKYQLTISEDNDLGVKRAHYIEDQSLISYNYDHGLPVMEIVSNTSEWDECKMLGEEVLATLRSSTP